MVDSVGFIVYGSTKGVLKGSKVILNTPQIFYNKSYKNVRKVRDEAVLSVARSIC